MACDTMGDDAREAELVILRTANGYLWNGNAKVKSPDGRVWLGLKADPSLVQETTSLDMSINATTASDIVAEVRRLRDIIRITNNCSNPVDLGISREMMSYWEDLPYSVNDESFGTVLSHIESLQGMN